MNMKIQMSRHVDTATVNYPFEFRFIFSCLEWSDDAPVRHVNVCQLLCHNKCALSLLPRALYTTGWTVKSVFVSCHVHMSICSLGFNPSCG